MSITEFVEQGYPNWVSYVKHRIKDTAERDAEDIVHDVLTNFFDKADITAPVKDLSAYVYRSLKNKIVDLFRKHREKFVSFDNEILTNTELKLSDVLHDIRYDTFSEVEKNEIREKLFKAIDSLKNEEKALIIATEFEGESFKELSEKWDEPLGTLLSRKSRALKKLKKILNQYK